jgi:hypothetical protein
MGFFSLFSVCEYSLRQAKGGMPIYPQIWNNVRKAWIINITRNEVILCKTKPKKKAT